MAQKKRVPVVPPVPPISETVKAHIKRLEARKLAAKKGPKAPPSKNRPRATTPKKRPKAIFPFGKAIPPISERAKAIIQRMKARKPPSKKG